MEYLINRKTVELGVLLSALFDLSVFFCKPGITFHVETTPAFQKA
jgi:hypothetical protein